MCFLNERQNDNKIEHNSETMKQIPLKVKWISTFLKALIHIARMLYFYQIHYAFNWWETLQFRNTSLILCNDIQFFMFIYSTYIIIPIHFRFEYLDDDTVISYSWNKTAKIKKLRSKMFTFHKPKVFRSINGCCICGAKSSR